jgi:hypothetical protein
MLAHYAMRGIEDPFNGTCRTSRNTYKNFDWMVEETNRLAEQLFKEEIMESKS